MITHDIQTLIDRFLDGKSSLDEERELADYIKLHADEPELAELAEMFRMFDAGITSLDDMADQKDSTPAINTAEPLTDVALQSPSAPPRHKRHIGLYIASAAAVAALLLTIGLSWFHANEQVAPSQSLPASTVIASAEHESAESAQVEATDRPAGAKNITSDATTSAPSHHIAMTTTKRSPQRKNAAATNRALLADANPSESTGNLLTCDTKPATTQQAIQPATDKTEPELSNRRRYDEYAMQVARMQIDQQRTVEQLKHGSNPVRIPANYTPTFTN